MWFKSFIVFYSFAIILAKPLQKPSYLPTCSLNAEFSKCATEAAKKAFVRIVEGDNKFNVPSLKPLKLPRVAIDSPNLKLEFTDLTVEGLSDTDILSIEFDFDKRKGRGLMFIKDLHIIGKYDINGRILILPISGKGESDVHFLNGTYDYTFDWEYKTKEGKRYLSITKPGLDLKLGKATFDFQNLFNGDPKLGPEINKFANENWEDLLKDIGAPITNSVEAVATQVLKGYFGNIPVDELLIK